MGLLLLTLAAFSNSFTAGFTLDNQGLLHDPRITAATVRNLGLIAHHSYWWPEGEAGLYRPLTTLTYLFNYAILGNRDQPAGYHWFNFIMHAANVLLVFWLLLRLTANRELAGFVAAAWAVQPVLTESVTNIVGRADLLAGCATLGGFLVYLKSAESSGARRAAWLGGLFAITLAGAFSKESAVCILPLIALYELVWWRRGRLPALLLACAATAAAIGIMLVQRSRVLAASLPAEFPFTDNPLVDANFWTAKLTALGVIARYMWLCVWPAKLSADYSYPQIPLASGTPQEWLCWIVVLAAVALVIFAYRWSRVAFFFACFAAVTFFPMSNLAFPIGTIMAERFLYLPSLGIVVCAVLAICGVSERWGVRRFAPAAIAIIVACLAIRTWARNADWQDQRSIIQAGLEVSPRSYKLHKQMAVLMFPLERTAENIGRGSEEAGTSVNLLSGLRDDRNTAEPYCLAGEYRFLTGELESAQARDPVIAAARRLAEYRQGIALVERCKEIDQAVHAAYLKKLNAASPSSSGSPRMTAPRGDPQPYLMLSAAYQRLNEIDNATAAVREALRLHPRTAAGYFQIANVFMAQNRRDDAAAALTEGMLLTTDVQFASALATLYHSGPEANQCQVRQMANGVAIDPHCAPLRRHVCALAEDVLKARREAGREDLAEDERTELIRDYGCSLAP